MNRGFLVTRGLGCKGLLVTRGLGKCRVVIIPPEVEERPRQLTNQARGRSGRPDERRQQDVECIYVNARLIEINGVELPFPVEGDQKVDCNKDDTLRVTTTMPRVQRRTKRIVIKATILRDPEDI